MKKCVFGFLAIFAFAFNANAKTWQVGLDLLNSAAAEYHFENNLLLGLEIPFNTEHPSSRNSYATVAKLEYSPGIRAGWKLNEFETSSGYFLVSFAAVKGTGIVDVGPAYPSRSTNAHSIALKYSHRWYWENFALGLGGGYRHNTQENVFVPFTGQPDFDIKLEQGLGPVFGEVSIYAVF